MQKTRNQLYNSIKDLKTKEEFEKEIKTKAKEYDNLIDENIIALLIVDELGRNIQTISKISDLQSGTESTIIGKIIYLFAGITINHCLLIYPQRPKIQYLTDSLCVVGAI